MLMVALILSEVSYSQTTKSFKKQKNSSAHYKSKSNSDLVLAELAVFQKDTANFTVYNIILVTIPGLNQASHVLVLKQFGRFKKYWRVIGSYSSHDFNLDTIKKKRTTAVYQVKIYDTTVDKSAMLDITLKKRKLNSLITINTISSIVNHVEGFKSKKSIFNN